MKAYRNHIFGWVLLFLLIPTSALAAVCDVDGDNDVDRNDVMAIAMARNTPATDSQDPRDANGDGIISVLDARVCVAQCTLSRCAIIDPPPATESTVNGRITLPDGTVLDGVDILASSSSTDDESTTSADGLFSLDLEAGTEYVLQLSGAGLADQVVPVMSPLLGSAISLEITMIARGEEQTFTAGRGNLVGTDGAAADVDGIDWVDAAGNPVIGEITATITPVDVSSSAALGAFPGEFSGIAAGDVDEGAIVSYGVVEFEFSQNGAPVQPAPGQLVTVLIPIYFDADQDGNPFVGGEIIELWSLNEDTGIWEQDGTGVVVPSADSPSGWALQANVSHFSWWNCDVSMNAADAFVTVFGDRAGSAVVRATTDANIGWRPNSVETVVTVGVVSGALNVPSTGEVCFSADITYNDGIEAATQEVCVNPPANGAVFIDLFAPATGPLKITATPTSDIEGFVNFPVDRVRLFPTSLETSVSYSIVSGSLPAGMSLIQTTSTRAEIAGVPTQAGLFSVTVEGNDGSETASVVVNYDISSDVPPPLIGDGFISVELRDTQDSYDLNDDLDLLNGGAADSWMLLEYIEGGPIPSWLDLDTENGILSINTDVEDSWFGRIRVINASGEDEVFLDICAGFCFGEEGPS